MISQPIANLMPDELARNTAADSERAALRDMLRQSWLYSASAEVSYILRWLILKAISAILRLVPGRQERRERLVIELGNKMFHPMLARDVYRTFDSYVSVMDSSLDVYKNLFSQEQWLRGHTILDLGSGLGQYSQLLVEGGASSVTGLEYQESKATWSAARSVSPKLRFVVVTFTGRFLPRADRGSALLAS